MAEYSERIAVLESEVKKLEMDFFAYKKEHYGEHKNIDDTLKTTSDNHNTLNGKMDLLTMKLDTFITQYIKDKEDGKTSKVQWFNVVMALFMALIAVLQVMAMFK